MHLGDDFHIRPADEGDAPAIRQCARDAYARYVAAIGQKPAPMVADFDAAIAAGTVHVAISATQSLLGFVVFYPEDDHMLLENVAVRPDAAGQGIGKRLILFCEAEARRLSATSVRLYTNEKMVENLSIYPHLGYREVARRREDGFDRVFFEKTL